MTMSQPRTKHEQAMAEAISTRAAVDKAFRSKLLSDPGAAVAEVLGHEPPAGLRIKFVEKDPDLDALIVLPDLASADSELSTAELEAVAGGLCWDTCSKTCVEAGTVEII
jgi:hypothetical protein